jgi:hypothetical protein
MESDLAPKHDDLEQAGIDLDRVWTGISGEIWARERGAAELLLGRVLRSPGLARALVATPSLLVSWLIATGVVMAVGVVATNQSGTSWIAVIAPAVAAVGIAYAYGPGIDPAYELSESMAVPTGVVLIARCVAVFGLNALLGAVSSLLVSGTVALTFSWLVPMTTISAFALAVALRTRSSHIGLAAALGVWGVILLGRGVEAGSLANAAEPGALLPFYLIATIVFVIVTYLSVSGKQHEGLPWQ